MKRFLIAAVVMMAATSVNAQNNELKDEIGISYGLGLSVIGDGIGNTIGMGLVDGFVGREWTDEKVSGTIAVEYFHHLGNPKLAVGGILTWAHYGEDVVNKDNKSVVVAERSRNYVSLMPAVKYAWVNNEHFAFYSKAAVGLMVLFNKDNDIENNKKNNDQGYFFMWQASPVGIEFGSKVRGFAELGVGEQGFALAGVRYKF